MSLSEMQDKFLKRMTERNKRKKVHFVIGAKLEHDMGKRPKHSMSNKFKTLGRSKNKNTRYMAQLVLGDNT